MRPNTPLPAPRFGFWLRGLLAVSLGVLAVAVTTMTGLVQPVVGIGIAFLAASAISLFRMVRNIQRLNATMKEIHCRNNLRCIACGYDLRASTGRCPECGRLPSFEH